LLVNGGEALFGTHLAEDLGLKLGACTWEL